MAFSVKTEHAEYQFYKTQWKMEEDFDKGEQAVKAGGTDYLPTPFINVNNPKQVKEEYEQFKNIAPFLGFTSKTKNGLAGTITRKPIDTENIQSQLEYLIDNANGGRLGLNQHVNRTVSEVVLKGRFGLLTELPMSSGELSRADNENGQKPFIVGYKAQDIINWVVKDGELILVVLREQIEKDIDEQSLFGAEMCYQYRVLMMEDGKYKQRLYSDNNESMEVFTEIDVTFNGQSFSYIPFDFVGAQNNDETCDESIMYSIVVANKNHYYNSALDQNITTCCSMMMLAISTSLDTEEQKDRFPNGITYGSREGYFFGEGDTITIVQATESNSASRKANEILEGAKQLGAQLVEPSSNMTATEANIRSASDGSAISTIAVNTEDAYNNQLANISLVLGSKQESTIEVNKSLFAQEMTPEMRRQWVEEVMLGIVPKQDYYDALRKAELITDMRTNEDLESSSMQSDSDSISNNNEV